MGDFLGRRLGRALLYSFPLALSATLLVLWRHTDAFAVAPLLWMRDGLMPIATVASGFGAVMLFGVGLFWRGPAEVRAMARTVATLEHEVAIQRLELKATIDFLGAEREIGLILNEDVEFRAILEKVLAIIARLLGGAPDDEIEVFVVEKETGKLRLKGAWTGGKAWFDRLGKLKRDDDLVRAAMAQTASRLDAGRLTIGSPVSHDGETIGVLRLHFSAVSTELQARVLAPHVGELARFVGLALKTPDLYTRAVEDGLTGLATKRHFQSQIDEMVERAKRFGEPLSIVMVDIDHFKKINDTHGHLSGDYVLKDVAQILKQSVRVKAGDRAYNAYRYGGEEMSLLLPRTTLDRAAAVAERVRATIQGHPFRGDHKQSIPVTASFGVAQFDPLTMKEPADLIKAADEALYRSKEGGRNQVQVAAAPAGVPEPAARTTRRRTKRGDAAVA
jgi:diguanylate cyclase (GGDEF)-like protein